VSDPEWTLLAILAAGRQGDAGREDAELRTAAFRLVDRMARSAQRRSWAQQKMRTTRSEVRRSS
jgi:hypothetical protein